MKKNKRRKRKNIISLTLIIIALLLIIGCAAYIGYSKMSQSAATSESTTESTTNSIQNTDFKLSDDLSGAIAILAQSYNNFDSTSVEGVAWQDFFISHYLMNSHYSFNYLDELTAKNSNIIDEEEAEYMSYSLTGIKSDFNLSEPLNYDNASSFLSDAFLESYTAEVLDDGVLVHAVITTTQTTIQDDEPVISDISFNADVKLVNNHSSCFDGYSISSLECNL